tara:strand:- start:405 stop:932 length:528 start_codon:yes stop_codon:yes gene_type:complete
MNFIKFTGENRFLVSQFQDIYDQRILSKKSSEIKGIKFDIFERNQKISIINSDIKLTFNCPVSFSEIFSEIQSYLFKYNFRIGTILFYPFNNLLKSDKETLKLNFIHNIILTSIFLNDGNIQKEKLYKLVWPNDYDTSVNKLDTHFTNLKELVKLKFNIDLVLKSNQGLVSLTIN